MKRGSYFLAFLFFLAVSLFYTYPLILKISTTYYGVPGESAHLIWRGWWFNFSRNHQLNNQYYSTLSAPGGFYIKQVPTQPFWDFTSRWLSFLLGEVRAYNFWIIASYFLSGFFMFILVTELTGNFWAGLFSGFFYSLIPFRTFHFYQNTGLGDIQWLPLYFYFLLKTIRQPGIGPVFWAAGSLAVIILDCFYYGFFTLLFSGFFIILLVLFNPQFKQINSAYQLTALKTAFLLVVFGLALVFVLLLMPPFAKNNFLGKNLSAISATNYASRFYADLFRYSARAAEYFIPPVDQPLWGNLAEKFFLKRLHGSNLFEQTLYLGFSPLLLVLAGFFFFLKEKNKSDSKIFFLIFTGGALFAFYTSLSPRPHFLGLSLWSPSFFLYKFFPMFRAYVRFAVWVVFCLAVLAGLSLKIILGKISKTAGHVLVFLLLGVVLVEFLNWPPPKLVDLTPSESALWLAKKKGDFIIAEYPLTSWLEPVSGYFTLNQRIHHKKIFNVTIPASSADQIRAEVIDLNNPRSGPLLARLGIKYVVVNKNIFFEGRVLKEARKYFEKNYFEILPAEWNGRVPFDLSKNKNFKLVASFKNQDIYQVTATPAEEQIIWADNFWPPERWEDGAIWRWMHQNGILKIKNYTPLIKKIKIGLKVRSFHRSRKLSIFSGDKLLNRWQVLPEKIINLGPVVLEAAPGENSFEFRAEPGPDNIYQTTGILDGRDVSCALNFLIIDTR
jgi:hypothetical protein